MKRAARISATTCANDALWRPRRAHADNAKRAAEFQKMIEQGDMMRSIGLDYLKLSADYDKLIDEYNALVDDYNALLNDE
jgi:hypothetical protein